MSAEELAQDCTIKLWNTAKGGDALCTLQGHSGIVRALGVLGDGVTLVSGSDDETIKLWDSSSGKHLHTLEGNSGNVKSLAVLGDGLTLASGSFKEITILGAPPKKLPRHEPEPNIAPRRYDEPNIAPRRYDESNIAPRR